ncbi:MAG: M14 family zinc carboxypeptidase [Bacteroidota bacterium]
MKNADLAVRLLRLHARSRLSGLRPATCRHRGVVREIQTLVGGGGSAARMEEVGSSSEGRSLLCVSFGRGPVEVLLWSQMHGDEPTATLALLDIATFLARTKQAWAGRLLERTTIRMLPMLNPDGARRVRRGTALGIDMNRDARRGVTPEAAALLALHRRVRPRFAFNLHDQELSSAGDLPLVTALALLAPASGVRRQMKGPRLEAARLCACIARSLHAAAAGHIARYDDVYERRAFGDAFQAKGTATVLVESGHWPGDPEKNFIRALNFAGILTALHAVANGSYRRETLRTYLRIPENGKRVFDLIIRDVSLRTSGGALCRADLGLTYPMGSAMRRGEPRAILKEVGDLSTFGAMKVVHAWGRSLSPSVLRPDGAVSVSALHRRLGIPS